MPRRGLWLSAGAGLCMAGCSANHAVEIRPVGASSARPLYGGDLLARARAELSLGAPGVALESFRKLQREDAPSADSFAGIAACYAAMGRFDLARQNYEFALAYRPDDRVLLTALAGALDQLGETQNAAEVRLEASRQTSPVALAQAATPVVRPVNVPARGTITVNVPAATDATARSDRAASLNARSAMARRSEPGGPPKSDARILPDTGNYSQRLVAMLAARSTDRSESEDRPQEGRPGPYLERLSSGEVALRTSSSAARMAERRRSTEPGGPSVTERAPPFAPDSRKVVAATLPNWVPLGGAGRRSEVLLLNAARQQGLAARTRTALAGSGLGRISIGDARLARSHSLILYAADQEKDARRLAARIRCPAILSPAVRFVTVLLGRDAPGSNRGRRG